MSEKFMITVTQTLSKEFPVFADTKEEALEKANDVYLNNDMEYMADNDVEIDTSFDISDKQKREYQVIKEVEKLKEELKEQQKKIRKKINSKQDEINKERNIGEIAGLAYANWAITKWKEKKFNFFADTS